MDDTLGLAKFLEEYEASIAYLSEDTAAAAIEEFFKANL